MKRFELKNLAGVAVLVAFGSAGMAAAGEIQDANVTYRGDNSALAVCRSIVRDDVQELRDAFRRGRSYPTERVHLAYECNQLALDEFAFTQNAEQVSDYLAPMFDRRGVVTIEQVGSINE